MFCKNEGSKRSMNNEKGGQQDWHICTKCFITVNWQNLVTNEPTLGPIIFGTKWDRDNLIFLAERGSQWE